MKLASYKNLSRDGMLVLVSNDLTRCAPVPSIAPTLQRALDNWTSHRSELEAAARALESGALESMPFDEAQCMSPLPRAFQWADGSAYVTHVELVRRARGVEMPPSFWTDPLMYQGGSDVFLGPQDDIQVADEAWGIDLEAEIAVITTDVPMGVTPEAAADCVALVMLVNDVTLRALAPAELQKGFGFFHTKPPSSFSPVAVTPEALGDAWREGKLHLPLRSFINGTPFGWPDAGVDMTFNFAQLIAHAAKTRPLMAGSIIGSGTVSNKEGGVGSSCLVERRMLETIEHGEPKTPFLKFGDRVRIEMTDAEGRSIFGAIDQQIVHYSGPMSGM